jgi:hypothetical protein
MADEGGRKSASLNGTDLVPLLELTWEWGRISSITALNSCSSGLGFAQGDTDIKLLDTSKLVK